MANCFYFRLISVVNEIPLAKEIVLKKYYWQPKLITVNSELNKTVAPTFKDSISGTANGC